MNGKLNEKPWGCGSMALLISIVTMIITYGAIFEGMPIDDYILSITIPDGMLSIIMWCISIYLGDKYIDNYGAKLGFILGKNNLIFFMILLVIALVLFTFR